LRRSTIFEFLNRNPILPGTLVKLRPRKLEDCANEYRWRTDKELCQLDAGVPLALTYDEFLTKYSAELEFPGLTYTLAIDTLDGIHIGVSSVFNLDFLGGSTEIGIMIGERAYWAKGYGADALKVFTRYIFQTSDLDKITLRTLNWNSRAQKCFEKCGFIPCGNSIKGNYHFIRMETVRKKTVPG
jgi:RimJ/RimL family protein N-acetyltransferase